jgi:hypothetical protein
MRAKFLLALAVSLLKSPAAVFACSVCFSGDDDALTHAFNWSVGFLLAAPYAIGGTVAACLVIAHRRAAAQCETAAGREAIGQVSWSQEESAK